MTLEEECGGPPMKYFVKDSITGWTFEIPEGIPESFEMCVEGWTISVAGDRGSFTGPAPLGVKECRQLGVFPPVSHRGHSAPLLVLRLAAAVWLARGGKGLSEGTALALADRFQGEGFKAAVFNLDPCLGVAVHRGQDSSVFYTEEAASFFLQGIKYALSRAQVVL